MMSKVRVRLFFDRLVFVRDSVCVSDTDTFCSWLAIKTTSLFLLEP